MWLGCKIIEDFILLQCNTPRNNGNGKKPRSHLPSLRICLLAYLRKNVIEIKMKILSSLILQMKVVVVVVVVFQDVKTILNFFKP